MKDVSNILKAINLVDLEGLKRIDIQVSDLKLLRDEIKLLEANLKRANHTIGMLQSDLVTRLNTPQFEQYC